MRKYGKFAILVVLIVGTLIWIATSSMADTQTYYKTIAELGQMGTKSMASRVRVGGDVAKGSIQRTGEEVDFTLVQQDPAKPEQTPLFLKVAYTGRDPLPDTFRDGAQALADGKMGPDGVFHASKIQAKCASKYATKPGQAPEGLKPATPESYKSPKSGM
jgi:cytochrome c-type biogenesis protein CcmE